MARRRYLSTEISLDKAVNRLAVECGDFAALLYTWMIPHADDDATLTGDADELLWKVVPGRRDKTAADIDEALIAMEQLGLVERDREKRRIGFPPVAFYRYQAYVGADRRRTELLNPASLKEAQNGAERRTLAQKPASLSVSSSVSSSISATASLKGEEGAVAPADGQAIDPRRVVELWNEICTPMLPAVQRLTDTRRQKVRVRCNEERGRDEVWWCEYFQHFVSTPFLRGENGRSWRADFDFAVNSETNVAKVLEGKYGRASPPKRNTPTPPSHVIVDRSKLVPDPTVDYEEFER